MKKVLFIMMFGLMFGQTNVTSKMISYDLSIGESNIYLPIDEFIGFELERGSIEFVGFDGEISDYEYGSGEHLHITYHSIATGFDDSVNGTEIGWKQGFYGNTNYYFDDKVVHIGFRWMGVDSDTFNGTLHFIVTAEFPEEDSGYIEEGFEYCINEGNNLVSYPCDNAIPIAEAIPSSETFLDAIIGEGVAASYLEGVGWVGSLGNLQSGDGYWFQANTNVCFQYECSE